MAKKRQKKKSRGAKKGRKDRPSSRSAPAVGESADEASPGKPSSSVETDSDDAPSGPPAADGDDGGVDAVIDVDGELDDPESRAELIAAAADGAEADGGPETAAEAAADADPEIDDGRTTETSEAVPPAVGAERGEEPDAADRPLIGADALVALSQFRAEGIATIPDELILELGDTASPEERDRLLAAALAHVEMRDAVYRVPTESGTARRWKGIVAALVIVLALLVTGLPPDFLVPDPPPALTTQERLRGIRVALLLQAQQIRAFEVREGRLPASLAEVDFALPGIRFVRSNDRLFQLVAYTPDGDAVVYDSAAPDTAFAAVSPPWLPKREGS